MSPIIRRQGSFTSYTSNQEAMVIEKQALGGLEWQVMVPDGSLASEQERVSGPTGRAWLGFLDVPSIVRSKVSRFTQRLWKTGADDPRKLVHCIKVGLALTLVSLFYYTRPLYEGVGGTAMWAVMTVVVVFEFTVGGCLYKGFNRALATLSAGALAIGIHWLASKSGETMEHVILGTSVFFLSSAATFARFIPSIKSRFDYGVMIFILTFSFVAISGYRVDRLLEMAQRRVYTITIGISISLIVCILVRPVWAGEDLHLSIIRNMENLADALEVCVTEYLKEGGALGGKVASNPKSQGYKCVLNSKGAEETLANLAIWEPPHGLFGFGHPWRQYLKVGAAMRCCAYCIEALNGCILSETQAPELIKKHLGDVCIRLSSESSKVLKESANSIKLMKKSSIIDLSVMEMNASVEELYDAFRLLPQDEEGTNEKRDRSNMLLTEALPIITVASLLIEISLRIEGMVDAVEELAALARFGPTNVDKPEPTKPITNSSMVPQGQDGIP